MYDVKRIAGYFLEKSKPGTRYAITHLKLQKLIYYAQAWSLANNSTPLFKNEILAWDHGPVIREIFDKYKKHRRFTIHLSDEDTETKIEDEHQKTLDFVWKTYGKFHGKFLEELTHQEYPWLSTTKDQVISNEKMTEYYGKQLLSDRG